MSISSAGLCESVSAARCEPKKERTYISAMLSNKNRKYNQTEACEERGVYNELEKEFVRAFRNNSAHPWTEVIKFSHTAISVAVMMRPIRLELAT